MKTFREKGSGFEYTLKKLKKNKSLPLRLIRQYKHKQLLSQHDYQPLFEQYNALPEMYKKNI